MSGTDLAFLQMIYKENWNTYRVLDL